VVLREVVPGPVRMAPAPPPQIIRVPVPMAQSRPVPPRAANRDGALVIDLTAGSAAAVQGSRGAEGAPNTAALASNDEAASATLIRNRASVIPQGTVIAAVLETPLNSDRPGWRAPSWRRMRAV
jgi:type IV secretion system protein VirB10